VSGADIHVVFLDIGGVMYDDSVYARSWARALRESGAAFTDEEFDEEYAAARSAQAGSFRRRLAFRFLGQSADIEPVERIASANWAYPPESRHPGPQIRRSPRGPWVPDIRMRIPG